MKKLMNSFNQWRFDKKIQLLVSTSIVLTTFLVLIVSTTSTVRFMKVQSTELLQAQNNTIAENFRNSLDNYKKLAIAVVLDTSIQQFLKSDSGNTASYIDNKNNANNTLSSIVNMHSDLNFIAVVDDQSGEYLYKGEQTIYNSNFIQTYSKDYESCKPANSSTMRVSFNNAYYDGNKYFLNYEITNNPYSIGKVRMFNGVAQVIMKAYAWIMSLGAEGLYEVAKIAVLNNNYMFKKLMEIECVDAPYIKGKQRIEQVRYTLEKMTKDTGITSGDIQRRMMDFGMHYWTSHHPYYVPEPATLEPTETPSKEDLDEYIETLKHVFREAYENPEIIKTAPHRSVCHQVDESGMDDPAKWAITWRAYLKKYK